MGTFKARWTLCAFGKPLLGIVGLLFLTLHFGPNRERAIAGINDFVGMYTGADLAGTAEQFQVDAYLREQERATGWTAPSILSTRPPAFALLLRPLTWFDYQHAYAIWQTLSLAAFVTFLIIWPFRNRASLLVAACWSFPLFASLWNGQDTTFVLLAVACAWRLASSSPFKAGMVLALVTVKFHLFLLVIVFLAAQRRRRMLAGAAVTIAIVISLCFAVAGAHWLPEYLRFVLQKSVTPSVPSMPNLRGLLEKLPYGVALEITGAVLASLGSVYIARKTTFAAGMSTALIASLLVSPHAYMADMLLLLPALLTLAEEEQSEAVSILCIVLLSPLPFLVQQQSPLAAPLPLLLITLFVAVLLTVRKDRALSRQYA